MLVAITGRFCSGKSTLARFLRRAGFRVFDSDRFVAALYRRPALIRRVRKMFGAGVMRGGKVDRAALASAAFSSRKSLRRLESIIHPPVRREIRKIRHGGRLVFAEVPVLYEARMEGMFGKVICVACSRASALRRARRAGFSRKDFDARSSFRLPGTVMERRADFLISSECPLRAFRRGAKLISNELATILAGQR